MGMRSHTCIVKGFKLPELNDDNYDDLVEKYYLEYQEKGEYWIIGKELLNLYTDMGDSCVDLQDLEVPDKVYFGELVTELVYLGYHLEDTTPRTFVITQWY